IGAVKYGDQRAGLKLFGHGGDVLQALGLAEHPDEAVALGASAAKHSPLGEDDSPRGDAEYQQDDEDGFGDETAGFDETGDFTANDKAEETAVNIHSVSWPSLPLSAL